MVIVCSYLCLDCCHSYGNLGSPDKKDQANLIVHSVGHIPTTAESVKKQAH